MSRTLHLSGIAAAIGCLLAVSSAQVAKTNSPGNPASTAQRGLDLVQAGHCQEALPLLKQSTAHLTDKQLKLKSGLAIVRCAMTLNQPATATSALEMLNRDYPQDPEVLYISVHAFSDLSTRAAQQLALTAPNSQQAHELNAEALEMQGKWDAAAREYETILKQNPNAPGIHFRFGRLLLSKPNPPPDVVEKARTEFEAELKIDPSNAGAEYVLGELAREEQKWDEAIQHFSRASKLDPSFAGAFLGLGEAFLSVKKYEDAIPPLQVAVKLEPANPATHYNLGTAYSRAGRKAEAEKEFAIHSQMMQKSEAAPDSSPQEHAPQHPN